MAVTPWVPFCLFVMYISDAKFKEHCSNISRDILDIYCCTVLVELQGYDVIALLICMIQKRIKKKRHSSLFRKAFQIISNYLSLFMHFKLSGSDNPSSPHIAILIIISFLLASRTTLHVKGDEIDSHRHAWRDWDPIFTVHVVWIVGGVSGTFQRVISIVKTSTSCQRKKHKQ